jgi:hypothetical protein
VLELSDWQSWTLPGWVSSLEKRQALGSLSLVQVKQRCEERRRMVRLPSQTLQDFLVSPRLGSPSGLVSEVASKPVKRVKPSYLPPSQEGRKSD